MPDYIGSNFDSAPPGHRFRLYFAGWGQGWKLDKSRKNEALSGALTLPNCSCLDIEAVTARQERLAAADPVAAVVTRVTTSPFTTGLGIEHPLENGFAFLDPYGLPYLPGSSVKGVLRRAAEELALFETDSQGWSVPAIWWLFGFDANSAFFVPDGNDPQPIIEERRRWREELRNALKRLTAAELELLGAYIRCACAPQRDTSAPPLELVSSWIPADGRKAPEVREIHTRRDGARGVNRDEEGNRPKIRDMHSRGALEFWDVIPKPPDGKLRVDIMNPHYGHYYQGGNPPGDWGDPVPIFFLALPPGTKFTFIARFRPPRNWPEPVRLYFESAEGHPPRWKNLVEAAFAHAFDWLGFGAKTAVGYGRMHTLAAAAPPGSLAGAKSGSAHGQSSRSVPEQRGGAEPKATGHVSSELEQLSQLLQSLKNPAAEKAKVERLVNEIARHHSHPAAPQLAAALWHKVESLQWLASKVRKQLVFWELVQKGGGT